MTWLKWMAAFAALVVMVYACALPGELSVGRTDGDSLAGVYTVNGVDPVGGEYSGTLTIVTTDRSNIFDVQWLVTGARQEGVGTLDGPVLTVAWTEVDNATGQGTGAIRYVVAADGTMVGTWSADGFDDPGTEQVYPEP